MSKCKLCDGRAFTFDGSEMVECPACIEGNFTPFHSAVLMLRAMANQMAIGCGNNGCRIAPFNGMGTNGPCHCTPRHFARELRDLASVVEEIKP